MNHPSETDVRQSQRGFWHRRLAGARVGSNFPTDRRRPPVCSFLRASVSRQLPRETFARLVANASSCGLPQHLVLIGATTVLISRYTGLDDLIVFLSVNGVHDPDRAGHAGTNLVAVRTSVPNKDSVRAFLEDLNETVREAVTEGAEYPFEDLCGDVLDVTTDRLHTISPVALAFEGFGVDVDACASDEMGDFDLGVTFSVNDDSLTIRIDFDREILDPASVEAMADQWLAATHHMASGLDGAVSHIPLVLAHERDALLRSQLGNVATFDTSKHLHTLFEERVVDHPDSIALVQEQQSLTFAQLNYRANQVAWLLTQNGVKPSDMVALYMDQSIEAIVGMLAILKVGAAYVPMNSNQPQERLHFQMEDSAASVVVTRGNLQEDVAATGLVVLCTDGSGVDAQPGHNPPVQGDPSDAAYLLYTSGSTGWPKGVVVEHRNVVRLFAATDHWFQFSADDTWTLFHSITFDFSVWEIWGALLHGGRLVIVDQMVARSPERFVATVVRERVTVLNQTPSAFGLFVRAEAANRDPLALRTIIFGGEALDIPSMRPWMDKHGDERPVLVNMYGITETTVHVTYRRIRRHDTTSGPTNPIGVPIPDLQVAVLDPQGHPAPVGVRGEIHVGGAGVARGYWRRDDLTAQRFVHHPFATSLDERLYRSGDEGRWLANGELEYLGRLDRQVKIRGFRIELAEIEAALADSPLVRESVVTTRDDQRGSSRLVAYVVLATTGADPIGTLRRHLAARLPEYMVPASILVIERVPLTVNGKLDRGALPDPTDHPERAPQPAESLSDMEQTIAAVWKELLGSRPIGSDDHFFELGGDSILAVEMVHAIRKRIDVELSVVDVFQFPTVRSLAGRVGQGVPDLTREVTDRADRQRQARARQRRRHGA